MNIVITYELKYNAIHSNPQYKPMTFLMIMTYSMKSFTFDQIYVVWSNPCEIFLHNQCALSILMLTSKILEDGESLLNLLHMT